MCVGILCFSNCCCCSYYLVHPFQFRECVVPHDCQWNRFFVVYLGYFSTKILRKFSENPFFCTTNFKKKSTNYFRRSLFRSRYTNKKNCWKFLRNFLEFSNFFI